MSSNLQKLSWNNYLEITETIDNIEFKIEFWSPIALIAWLFYGYEFCINQDKNNNYIIFYIRYKNSDWKVSTSFYKEIFSLQDIKEVIKNDLLNLNGNLIVNFDQISSNMITDWHLEQFEPQRINYISNYIYELEKFKTFSGKKLQKKRNHLNYFLQNNLNVEIKNIRYVNVDEILQYCNEHIIKYQGTINDKELSVYNHFLKNELNKTDKYKGIVVYLNNKIVGLTLCFLRKNICEIIIEKANRDIKGLYQFVVSENLKFNQINQKYMDRQDDVGNEFLAKSKKSYYPIQMINRYKTNKNIEWN